MLATVALLFFSYWPIVQNFRNTPADRYYYGQSEYPLDMLGDLAYVQQGYQGNLLASFNYSTMIGGHPTILKIEYTTVGLLGRALNISPVIMFFISRFAISLCVLFVIYIVIRRIFTETRERIVSYLFVLFGAGITLPGVKSTFEGYDVQVFQRLTQAMHHYLLGIGTMLLALYFLSSTLEKPKKRGVFVLALLFGIASSLIYAPDNLFLVSGFPLYIVLDTISTYMATKRIRVNMTSVGILFAYAMAVTAPILYVRYVTLTVWNDINVVRMESLFHFYVSPVQYFMVVGSLYVLSFIAIPWVLRGRKPILMILATWLLMHPVGEFLIAPLLRLTLIYFLTPYYVAFGILGTVGLAIVSWWIRKLVPHIPQWIVSSVLVVVVLSTSIGTYKEVWQGEHLCFCVEQFFDFGYPKKSLTDGIFWLSENTKPDDIVLSGYFAGALIPAFAGNRVYVSWWYRLIEPPTIGVTEANLALFYSGTMSDSDANAFLKRENISYVFYSEQEQTFAAGKANLQYPFLTDRYNKAGTVIYQVK